MEDPPWGFRRKEDEPLFKARGHDPAIVLDRVSPAIEGYFRIPAVWIGDSPAAESVQVFNPEVHHAVVFQHKMRCGMEVRVRKDGTFAFDFSSWPLAPLIVIPGYRIPDPEKSYRVPREHAQAEALAESYAVLRAQVMNVHQACLTTSEIIAKRRGAAMGFPVTAWSTYKGITFDALTPYHDDIENIHALAHNVLNNKDRVLRQHNLPRRVIEIETVRHSIHMLDEVLSIGNPNFIQIVEAAYMASCRQREKRFGEAVVLGWGVCEQLISACWDELLEDTRSDSSAHQRMPKDRQKKLTGREYTASVMVETLEINGRINHDLYRQLEIARKARNNWVHKMHAPKESEVGICITAIERLLQRVMNVRLHLGSSGRGGVPQWPVWMWEMSKAREQL